MYILQLNLLTGVFSSVCFANKVVISFWCLKSLCPMIMPGLGNGGAVRKVGGQAKQNDHTQRGGRQEAHSYGTTRLHVATQ